MIKMSGTLTIKTIDGRNGPFSIGRLVTELGDFTVKDTLLEQYEPGKYEGEFGVSRIYPFSYFANGGVKVEIRACVETIALAGIEKLTPEEEKASLSDTDPLDETPHAPISTPPAATPVKREKEMSGAQADDQDDEGVTAADPDVELFGTLWPLGHDVKLDPTVDRGLFRAQRDRLKALGYQFQAIGQVWIKKEGQ